MIKDNTMDYDKFGHCVKCHKGMYVEQIIGGKPTIRFTPDYTEKEYLLSDNTRMRVAICKDCKGSMTEDDDDYVMSSVVKGWDVATDELVKDKKKRNWDKKKKDEYMDTYSKLKIVCTSEDTDKDVLDDKFKKYKEEGK